MAEKFIKLNEYAEIKIPKVGLVNTNIMAQHKSGDVEAFVNPITESGKPRGTGQFVLFDVDQIRKVVSSVGIQSVIPVK